MSYGQTWCHASKWFLNDVPLSAEDVKALFHSTRELCCGSHSGVCHHSHTVSFCSPDTFPAQARMAHQRDRAVCTAVWTGYQAFSCSTQRWQPPCSRWVKSACQVEIFHFQNPQSPIRYHPSFLRSRSVRYNNSSFTLEGIPDMCHTTAPLKFYCCGSPWNSVGFTSISCIFNQVLPRPPTCLALLTYQGNEHICQINGWILYI